MIPHHLIASTTSFMAWHCLQTLLSEEEFKAAGQDADFWQDLDRGAAYENAKDFLALAKTPCPTAVVLQEGCVCEQPRSCRLTGLCCQQALLLLPVSLRHTAQQIYSGGAKQQRNRLPQPVI